VDVELACPVTDGKLIHFLRSSTVVHEERVEEDKYHLRVTVGRQLLVQLRANPNIEVLDEPTPAAHGLSA
jgi:hypothetical protein